MAEDKADSKVTVEKVEHKNIYAALAAFQGENPEIKKTKKVSFGEGSKKVEFWYSPLDEMLSVVRPLLAKHGLSFIHTEAKENYIQAVLFHETYSDGDTTEEYDELIYRGVLSEKEIAADGEDGGHEPKRHVTRKSTGERNVLRSMPIKVTRTGDMKEVGKESTYARRYTLGELLGIAPDEDNDIGERVEQLEGSLFATAKKGIEGAKTDAELTRQVDFFEKDLDALAREEKPKLGLKKEQLEQLRDLAVKRKGELRKEGVGKGKPGDNKDAGGTAEVDADK